MLAADSHFFLPSNLLIMLTSSTNTTQNTLPPEVQTLIENTKDLREKALDYMLKPKQALSEEMTGIFATILLMVDTVKIIEEA